MSDPIAYLDSLNAIFSKGATMEELTTEVTAEEDLVWVLRAMNEKTIPMIVAMVNDLTVTDNVAAAKLHAIINGQEYAFDGWAKRNHGDKPNREVAEKVAVARAFSKLAQKLTREANGAVKHADDVADHHRKLAAKRAAEAKKLAKKAAKARKAVAKKG